MGTVSSSAKYSVFESPIGSTGSNTPAALGRVGLFLVLPASGHFLSQLPTENQPQRSEKPMSNYTNDLQAEATPSPKNTIGSAAFGEAHLTGSDPDHGRLVPNDPLARLGVTVVERLDAAEGVVALTLGAAPGTTLPPWTPGAHIDVHVSDEIVRQYSLCSAELLQDQWRIGVLREPASRGGSQAVHEKVSVGQQLLVSHPRNNFLLLPSKRYLFIAGGIGVTPIISMIGQAERDGADWSLVYAGRSLKTMAFVDELSRYGDRVRFVPEDTDGRVDFAAYLQEPQDATLVYCCGPEPLLNAVEEATAHWPNESLHTERFIPKKIDAGGNVPFEVEFVESGLVMQIPADKSILEVAEEAGLPVISSCGEGTCGTCETQVAEGTPDHRDSILTDSEKERGDTMFICVSRSKGGCPLKLMI